MAIKDIKELAEFIAQEKGDVGKLFESLPNDMTFDSRITKMKQQYFKPTSPFSCDINSASSLISLIAMCSW